MKPWNHILQDQLPGWGGFLARSTYLVFLLIPFVIAIPVSFSPVAVFPPNGFTFKWYSTFFTSEQFNQGWRVSFGLAFAAATISTFVGASLSLAVTRYHFPGKNLLANLTLSPLIVPGVATGIGLVFYFTYVGIIDGWVRLITAHVIITTPYVVRVMIATLYAFDRSLEEAAMNLGATEPKVFLSVTLPIVRPGLLAGFIISFMASFENLPATIFVVQPGTYTLPVILFGYVRDDFNPIVAVVTVVMVTMAGFAMWIADRLVGINRLMGFQLRK